MRVLSSTARVFGKDEPRILPQMGLFEEAGISRSCDNDGSLQLDPGRYPSTFNGRCLNGRGKPPADRPQYTFLQVCWATVEKSCIRAHIISFSLTLHLSSNVTLLARAELYFPGKDTINLTFREGKSAKAVLDILKQRIYVVPLRSSKRKLRKMQLHLMGEAVLTEMMIYRRQRWHVRVESNFHSLSVCHPLSRPLPLRST